MILLENCDYFVRVVDFPRGARCKAMTILNDDGTFSVYLNARYTERALFPALRHELRHIVRDDLYGEKTVQAVEEGAI